MTPGLTEQFEAIAQSAIFDMERVECTIPEFIEGCGVVIAQVRVAQEAAEECHRATGETE